jgi:predicted ester cyclase
VGIPLVTLNRTAFPDLRVTIEHQVAEGDRVVTRYTMQGTYQGDPGTSRGMILL